MRYREIIDRLVVMAKKDGAEELVLPLIDLASVYDSRPDLKSSLYTFRQHQHEHGVPCMRPEGVAMCQLIASTVWKHRRDVKIFYVAKCWRFVKPQLGHHYEFTEFGYEVLNPRRETQIRMVQNLATHMILGFSDSCLLSPAEVRRGVSLTDSRDGFEISCVSPLMTAGRDQVCTGGSSTHECGFQIMVDRLMLLEPELS